MGIFKVFDKRKLEKKLGEAKRTSTNFAYKRDDREEEIRNHCVRIGSIIIDNDIQVDNEDVAKIKEVVQKLKAESQNLLEKRKVADKEVAILEEELRKLDGKVGCPNCGQVYDMKKDLLFCSKCGGSLVAKKPRE